MKEKKKIFVFCGFKNTKYIQAQISIEQRYTNSKSSLTLFIDYFTIILSNKGSREESREYSGEEEERC